MATLLDLDGVLYTALEGDAGVAAEVGTRIYALVAPAGADMPYITFDLVDGSQPETHSTITTDTIYRVHSWGSTRQAAADVHAAVYAALHRSALVAAGWSNTRTICEREARLQETFEGRQYYHFAWDVRIWMSEE